MAIVERCVEEGKRVIPMSATDKYFLFNKSLSVNWYNVILSIPIATKKKDIIYNVTVGLQKAGFLLISRILMNL